MQKPVSELKKHIARTHKEKRFTCQYCPKEFFDKKDCNKHTISLHTHERNFGCDSCSKGYKHLTELKDHIKRVHTVGYNFPCPNCESKFKVKRILLRHIEYVHNKQSDEVFSCTICLKELFSKAKLFHHIKSHE